MSQQLKSFALGTSVFPVPIAGAGSLPSTTGGGNTQLYTPIPKSGFLAKLTYTVSGTITTSVVATNPNGTIPLWRLINNYTLSNSLNYPFRSLSGDDIWMWNQVTATTASGFDPVVNSKTFNNPDLHTSTGSKAFSFQFVDYIGQNTGINFSRYLLSAMTTSNNLNISFTYATLAQVQAMLAIYAPGLTCTAFTASVQVSAEYLTVPDPNQYAWPRRNLVQQVLGDPSFQTPNVGLNVVNLTPIQGPEFTGLGIQVVDSTGAVDPLTLASSNISEIDIYVNGTIPLKQYTLADMIQQYERTFGRQPGYGYLYLDLSSDMSIPNVMSHTHRKVLSTAKYSQISVNVTLGSGFSAGAGAHITLLKRTQQAYASNQ